VLLGCESGRPDLLKVRERWPRRGGLLWSRHQGARRRVQTRTSFAISELRSTGRRRLGHPAERM
jgi:hypothetical protein